MNASVLDGLVPQRIHYYSDVDEPRINFSSRHQASVFAPTSWPIRSADFTSHASNSFCSAESSSGIASSSTCPSANAVLYKELVLHSSETWENATDITLFDDGNIGQRCPVHPKTYVPSRDLLDSSKKSSAAQQATSLCTAWITFSAGAQVDSIIIFNTSLSLAVQFFSDCSRAPRLRTFVTTKPLHYNVHETGTLSEFQSAAIPPLWSGDPRFHESNQLVTFASWSFWRERAPAVCFKPDTPHTPSFCTACSSLTGKSFRFHFLSNGDLIVIGSASGFLCRGSNIIADRDVALSAFQNFITSTEISVSTSGPRFIEKLQSTRSIQHFCQMAAAFEKLPPRSAWKSGENLYDRLIISSWAPKLNNLVTRAALDFARSDDLSHTLKEPKCFKNSHSSSEFDVLVNQTWEEYQEVESQQERDDRLYAQRLQDQELAADRLRALRSRREKQNLPSLDLESQTSIMTVHQRVNLAQPATSVSQQDASFPSSPSSKVQPDVISDSDSPQHSLHSAVIDADCFSTTSSSHKIRFVFKNDQAIPLPNNLDLSSISATTLLRSQNLFEVFTFVCFAAHLNFSRIRDNHHVLASCAAFSEHIFSIIEFV
jgi:hypothetical protein